jgi:hypothetical protein
MPQTLTLTLTSNTNKADAYIVTATPNNTHAHTHTHINPPTRPYHDRLSADRAHRPNARHSAPIELATRADAIRATAEHHHTAVVKGNVVFGAIVRAVTGRNR